VAGSGSIMGKTQVRLENDVKALLEKQAAKNLRKITAEANFILRTVLTPKKPK